MSLRRGLATFADRFEETVAAAAVVVIIGSVGWGVVTRYITEQPAAWASEVATLGFAWVVFFGASLTWGANASDPTRTSYRHEIARRLEEEYLEFYRFLANAQDEPRYRLHFSADAPLVINTLTRSGEQIVLADRRWTTRHPLVKVGAGLSRRAQSA